MSRRKSLSEQANALSDVTPVDVDPEALTLFSDNTAATASTSDKYDEDDGEAMQTSGRLLLQAEPDALNDPRYAGKTISRKELRPDDMDSGSSDNSDSSPSSDSNSDSDSDSDSDSNEHFEGSDSDSEEEDALDRRLSTFSNTSLATPKQSAAAQQKTATRAKHTLHQKKLWTDVLGVRVHLQPLLEMGNRLPNSHAHGLFHDHSDENVEAFASTLDSLTNLLRTCVSVSETLSRQHADIKALPQTRKRKRQASATEDLWDEMDTNYENFTPYRDAVLSRWNSKTQLQSGVSLNKKFKVVNQGILSQINSILSDESRLLKRTRTRRTEVSIIGEDLRTPRTEEQQGENEVDAEIFDDTDFFKHYRSEYLESTMSGDDFVNLSNSYATKRMKKKKKIDTKATKGRRLKYVVMTKLQNFCAPEHVRRPTIDVDVLLGSLFGGKRGR